MNYWILIPVLLGIAPAHAASQTKPAPATVADTSVVPVTSSRSTALPQLPAMGPVVQGAAQSGVRRCLPRMDQVVNFLSTGAQTGAMVFAAPVDADSRMSSVSLEVLGSNGLSYIDTSYAPTAVGCDAMYQTVTYWSNTCDEVAKVAFPSYPRASALRQHIVVLDGGPSAKVFLLPAGAGCISIKKEVLF